MVKVNNKMDRPIFESGFRAKVRRFLGRHSGKIYTGLVLLLALAIIFACCKIYSIFKLAEMQRAHANLADRASKVSFAKKYGHHPLGGLVLLDLGNEAFHGKNYKLASSYYLLAKGALKGMELATHSEILHALSLFNLGESEKGFAILDKIIRSKSVDECSRAEALYRYICCAKEIGRDDKIGEIAQYSKGLDVPDGWLKRIEMELN
jgi:hypothetical protein